MDISPVDSAVTAAARIEALNAANATARVEAPLITANQTDTTNTTASIVNFSPLAQLLAATVVFQTKQARQVPIAQPTQPGSSTNIDLTTLTEITTLFVNAFNNFQTSSTDGLTNQFDTAFENALMAAIQNETSHAGATHTQSFIDSLAQLGIQFQDSASLTAPNQFTIDWTRLETAFNANPAQTIALLSNAFQALNTIAETTVASQATLGLSQSAVQSDLLNNLYTQNSNAVLQPRLDTAIVNAADSALLTGATPTPTSTAAATQTAQTAQTTNTATTTTPAANPGVAAVPVTTVTPTAVNTTAAATTPLVTASATATANAAPATTPIPVTPVLIDPNIAAAVAAYRVNETIGRTIGELDIAPDTELIPGIGPVSKTKAVSLDTNEESEEERRVQRTRSLKERGQA
ncbi:hypothetical protein AAKU67_003172 [Oxalobacteraceae bacterium GrIS 2.11]